METKRTVNLQGDHVEINEFLKIESLEEFKNTLGYAIAYCEDEIESTDTQQECEVMQNAIINLWAAYTSMKTAEANKNGKTPS